jgi:hypothetical protein
MAKKAVKAKKSPAKKAAKKAAKKPTRMRLTVEIFDPFGPGFRVLKTSRG